MKQQNNINKKIPALYLSSYTSYKKTDLTSAKCHKNLTVMLKGILIQLIRKMTMLNC